MFETTPTVSRRSFVAAAAGTAAAGLAAAPLAALAEGANAQGMPEAWDYEADVVAVGGGITGFMAACAAAEEGASAIILEKMAHVGGDTAVSGQTIQGCWPAREKELYGVDDSIEQYIADWEDSFFGTDPAREGEEQPAEHPFSDLEAKMLPEVLEWLEAAGVEWAPTGDVSPTYIYPQPIWDTVFPRSWSSNTTRVMPPLEDKAAELGVEVLVNTGATSLIKDEDGRVAGVWCRGKDGERIAVRALKGVVLATGSFCGNKAMMMQYLPEAAGQVFSTGCFGNTGDGHLMAWEAGAALRAMSMGSHWITEETHTGSFAWFAYMAQFGGREGQMPVGDTNHILVNYDGKRFMSETEGYKWTGMGIAKQPYHEAYMVFDSTNELAVQSALATAPNPLLVCKADDLEGLAAQMKVPAEALAETVATWNGYVADGTDPEFGRHMENVPALEQAPFYAISLTGRPYTTYGGIDVDIDGHALTEDGQVIPGLYAAGTCTPCFCELEGLYYIGGLAQGSSYGRLVGKNIACGV